MVSTRRAPNTTCTSGASSWVSAEKIKAEHRRPENAGKTHDEKALIEIGLGRQVIPPAVAELISPRIPGPFTSGIPAHTQTTRSPRSPRAFKSRLRSLLSLNLPLWGFCGVPKKNISRRRLGAPLCRPELAEARVLGKLRETRPRHGRPRKGARRKKAVLGHYARHP